METLEDEEFLRIVLFRLDFVNAIKYFKSSKKIEDKFIRDGLIKIGIVTYAKPFLSNTGINKKANKYRLPKSMIPENFIWIHETLMNFRGNFIGHSNFKTVKPAINEAIMTPRGKMIHTEYLDVVFDHWFVIDEEFSEFPPLIDEILELIHSIIKDIPKSYLIDDVYS